MDSAKIWELIGRKLAGEATAEELEAIDRWKKEDKDNLLIYEQIKQQWFSYQENLPLSSSKEVFQKVANRIAEKELILPTKPLAFTLNQPLIRIAAAILILAIFSGLAYFAINQTLISDAQEIITHFNPKGVQTKIQLPDSSVVWLNADSKLSYPITFDEEIREIHLIGEAFFQVKHLSGKPFIIKLPQDQEVKVLGTSFNIKAFQEDEIVETSVVTGKVAFINAADNSQETVLIDPNHKATFNKNSGQIVKEQVDSQEDIAWIEGRLIFRATSLEEIAKTLERTYNVKVYFENESLKLCKITASFQKKEIEEIARLIAIAQEIEYELINGQLTFKGEGCK